MIKQIITLILLLCCNILAYGQTIDNNKQNDSELIPEKTQQQVIDEFKAYVAAVPREVQEEVIEFRESVAALNKQKREAYQQLSQAAQGYLAKEQEYKKKLPVQQKQLINLQNPGEQVTKKKAE